MTEERKYCSRCGLTKPVSEFYRIKGKPSVYCKACHNAQQVASRQKSPERYKRVKAANNAWQRQNPDVNREAQQRWRDRHRNETPVWSPLQGYVTIEEAAQQLGVGKERVGQLVDIGRLMARRDGGRVVIEVQSLKRLLQERGGSDN